MDALKSAGATLPLLAVLMLKSAGAADVGPMTFRYESTGGNCISCEWITASGTITDGTTKRFEQFLEKEFGNGSCLTVSMDSLGGNLLEGIRLGETLRRYGCSTQIGRSVPDDYPGSNFRVLEPGECYSACAYAFLGGVRRRVDEHSRYGVHQHYQVEAILAPAEKTLNALDMSVSQLLTGILVSYVIKTGADPLLVTLASTVAPTEEIYVLNRSELESLKVVTDVPPPRAEWRLEPIGPGLVAEVQQIQDDTGNVQRARLLCRRDRPSQRYLEIIIQVGLSKDEVRHELTFHHPLLIEAGHTFTFNNYDAEFVGSGPGRLLILRLALEELHLISLAKADKLRWFRDSSRAMEPYFSGWFSLNRSATILPYAFRHCI